jgi:hypothetical protein
MPDRYPVSEVVQIGVESTIGTAVVPTIQFGGLGVELDTAAEFDEFSPAGQIPGSIVAPRQEWSTGALSGYPTYTEMQYPLSNLLGAATITTPSGATLARQWVWTPSAATPWTPKSWTIRRGVAGGTAEEASYALLSGLMLEFSRTATPSISGDLFARRLDYAATLATTGVTVPTLVPILPAEGDIWLDSSGASLGTTKLLRDFMFSYSIADLLGPIWPINSSFNSFAAHGVQKPTLEAKLTLGNDAVGAAGLMANLRAGSSVFVRYKATSAALIEGATPYSLQIDTALKVSDAPSRSDQDGLLATLDWTFRNVYDATWGQWLRVTLINGSAAL